VGDVQVHALRDGDEDVDLAGVMGLRGAEFEVMYDSA
jgi:hypothetical protein